jgi:hypothetical protein
MNPQNMLIDFLPEVSGIFSIRQNNLEIERRNVHKRKQNPDKQEGSGGEILLLANETHDAM